MSDTLTDHISVLLQESIDGLDIKPGEVFLDGTIGSAGHSAEVAKRFGRTVKIIGLDADADAVLRAKAKLESLNADATIIEANFRDLDKVLDDLKIGLQLGNLFRPLLHRNRIEPNLFIK